MTPRQLAILNSLLRLRPDQFTDREKTFLVQLSTKLRYILVTRREGVALAKLGEVLLGRDVAIDPGNPNTFDGVDVRPEPETEHAGGPSGTRPPGTGDGNDVPSPRVGDG